MVEINVAVNANLVRQWHADLVSALTALGHTVGWVISNHSAPSTPASLELLLSTERLLRSRPHALSARKIALDSLPGPLDRSAAITINLDPTRSPPRGECGLRLLYDGSPHDVTAFSALLAGSSPVIEVERQPENIIVGRAVPSLEGAHTYNDAFQVVASVATWLLVRSAEDEALALDRISHSPLPLRMARLPSTIFHGLAVSALRKLYELCCFPSHWRVGWRFVADSDVLDCLGLAGPPWQSLANPRGRFLADPFPISWQGLTCVFAEDFDQGSGKGIISFVPFDQNGPTGPAQPVLEEPWHLSYPFLIEHDGIIWMIPESAASRQVVIYRADPFPTRWVREAVLLDDVIATDATIVRHAGRYWMFVTASKHPHYSDALEIYHAGDLLGPWLPHRRNPVLIDVASARSAGNIIRRNGRLWRPAQDCHHGYGAALALAQIDELTEERYRQTVRAVLRPGAEWPGRRLHTLNRAGNLECIDGSSTTFRFA